jgi:hypothetical protein
VNWSLALRLVLRGDRAGRVRLLLMTSGVALGVALLLGVAGVLPAVDARQQVLTNRTQAYDPIDAGARTEGVAALTESGFWRGRELHSLRFTVVGPPVTPPEGVRALPAPGEVLISPALRDALAGPHGSELRARIPGRVSGTIGSAGLTGPDELYFIAPAATGALAASGLGAGFLPKEAAQPSFDTTRQELKVAVPLAGIALIVPILILIATSTRLSAASRERRTAAMRLVGATRRQVAQLAAVEGAVVGFVGAVAGLGLFLMLRGPAATVLPVADGVHAASLSPGPLSLLPALVGVPVLAALTAPLSMRRVVSTPLGVSRQARLPKAGPARLLPLGTGLLLLLLAYLGRGSMNDNSGPVITLLLSGAALSLIGLAIAGAALARTGGAALTRWGRGSASQLAGRRLMLDPSAAARTVTGTALVVAVGGWVLAFIPVLDQAQNGYLRDSITSIRPGTVIAGLTDRTQQFDTSSIAGVDGVEAVVTADNFNVVPEGTTLPLPEPASTLEGAMPPQPTTFRALVADCAELARVLVAPLKGCQPDRIQLIELQFPGQEPFVEGLYDGLAPPRGRFTAMSFDGQKATGTLIEVPADASRVLVPAVTSNAGLDLNATILIPPSRLAAPRDAVNMSSVLIATDGTDKAVEAARTALAAVTTQAPPLTPREAIAQASKTTDAYRTAALVGLVVVVVAGGITLAVGTADGLHERHRAHAALVALGTPMAVLRRSVVLQVATPLLLTVALAVASSAVAARVYLELGGAIEDGLALPWSGYGFIAVAAVAATLLANAAALPLLRAAGRPGALRTE